MYCFKLLKKNQLNIPNLTYYVKTLDQDPDGAGLRPGTATIYQLLSLIFVLHLENPLIYCFKL